MKEYIKTFFDELEIYEDTNGNNYKETIFNSIMEFLEQKNEKTACNVYKSFFEAYWIGIQDEVNPFLELTQLMKKFEKNSGKLLEKHRDHYIHTVFVFLLGLSIYIQNSNYQGIFVKYALDKDVYPDSYETNHEEFFYRWGLASLSHDIAYPLEIIVKQANEYIKFVCQYGDPVEDIMGFKLTLSTSSEFLDLPVLKPKKPYETDFYNIYGENNPVFLADSIPMLSFVLSKNFKLDFEKVKISLNELVENMNSQGFIDHGFFSAIIMLRWYYHLIKKTNWHPAYFYFPVLDSSSAVLLHNFYKHKLMKDPFNLEPMLANQNPIAYLLILCDELQEWSRKGFGRIDTEKESPIDFNISISDSDFNINYKYLQETETIGYLKVKKENLNKVITIIDIFNNGLKINEEKI